MGKGRSRAARQRASTPSHHGGQRGTPATQQENAMTQDTRKSGAGGEEKRQPNAGKDDDKLETYDETLDEAVEETFPASDPISPAVAEKLDRKGPAPKPDAGRDESGGEADTRKK
jgi:hypothetical protein